MNNLTIIYLNKKYTYSYWLAVNKVINEKIYLSTTENFSYDSTKEFIKNKLKNNSPFLLLVNTENNSIVGWCDCEIFNDEKIVLGIGILEPYRNMGYGKLLIKKMISICKDKKYKYLCLQVRENNKRSMHVYSSLGFKEYNRITDVYYNNNFKEDIIEMVLNL